MFKFTQKKEIWDACDKGYLKELKAANISYQLKTAQDLSIYRLIRDCAGLKIGEIGGGNSRILEKLAEQNTCFNIEKFEGRDQGPGQEIKLRNVSNISAYIGEFSDDIQEQTFDLIFSISVVEHIATEELENFFRDSLRILKPGGVFIHAIDMYLTAEPSEYTRDRYRRYMQWVSQNAATRPLGFVTDAYPLFNPTMISNPDNILYGWNTLAPSLAELRTNAQNVSLLVSGSKGEIAASLQTLLDKP
jgi:SAM-dependent methyltransferase